MQVLGPVAPTGVQDYWSVSIAAAAPSAPVAAAAASTDSGETRSETGQRGQTPPRPDFPRPDPDRPTGPPPAFDTTPLELEAERRVADAAQLWGSAEAEPAERQIDIEV